MKAVALLAVLFVLGEPALAQIQINAGASTLFGAAGAGVTFYHPDTETYFGGSYEGGRFLPGAYERFSFQDYTVTAGTQSIGYGFSGASLGLSCICVTVTKKKVKRLRVSFFTGAIGGSFFSQWAPVAMPSQFGSGVFLDYHVKNLTLSSLDSFAGGKHTLAQGASYQFRQSLKAIATVGLLNNRTFLETSAIARIWNLNLSADHESYFAPFASTGNSVSVSDHVGIFEASIGANDSRALQRSAVGEYGSLGINVWKISEQTSLLHSRDGSAQKLIVHSVSERLTTRISVNQVVTDSNGHYAYAFGGTYNGNRVRLSLNHNLQFWVNGYERTTSISVSFRIHDTLVTAQTLTDPTGKTHWTGSTQSFLQSGFSNSGTHGSSGKYSIQGVCVDESGEPVEGCALQIQAGKKKDFVFSNAHGVFEQNVSKREIKIMVLPEEFTEGDWTVVSAPGSVSAGDVVKIVVRRRVG